MTRDEAIKNLWVPSPPSEWAMGAHDAGQFVDRLVALGVLKLDEPKDANRRFQVIASKRLGPSIAISLWDDLNQAGLKIIEK